MLKKLVIVGAIIAGTWPLAACLDGLDGQVANAIGLGTDKVLGEVQTGIDSSDGVVDSKVNQFLSDNGLLLPLDSVCSANSECQSNFCDLTSSPPICKP